jgi:3D (Asp-Asp-Asp) domain-containing protein
MKIRKINVFLVLALVLIPLKMLNTADRVDAAGMTITTVTSTVSQAVYTPQNTLSVWVTAYASVPEETDDTPFITASNKHVRDGFLAANFLPFGTKVTIPSLFGDKVFTVEDRMSKRKTGFVDVWMPSVSDAKDFGIHRAQIVIVGDAIAGNVASR